MNTQIQITIKKEDNLKVAAWLMQNGIEYSSNPIEWNEATKNVSLETPPVGEHKPFIAANIRDVLDLYDSHEITHSRMVEMLNEMSFKWHGKEAVKDSFTTESDVVEFHNMYKVFKSTKKINYE